MPGPKALQFRRFSVATFVGPPSVAVIFTFCFFAGRVVVMVNWAELLPDGIVTIAGTVTFVEGLAVSATAVSEVAGPVRATVPFSDLPPFTEPGFSDRYERTGELVGAITVTCVESVKVWPSAA